MASERIRLDRHLWRKLSIAFFSTINERELSLQRGRRLKDLREISLEDVLRVEEKSLKEQLEPVIPAGQCPPVSKMLEAIRPLVEEVLTWDEGEKEYLDALLDEGEVRAQSLFKDDPSLAKRWEKHPAILWKAQNVREWRSKRIV